MTIKPKEAAALVTALQGGVVPNIGIQHITVGRDDESRAILNSLRNVAMGNSDVKFWVGDFGSGKSFILQLIKALSLKMNYVIATADFDVDARLYSNDGKAVLIYQKLLNNLSTQTNQSGDALPSILEEWIEQILVKLSESNHLSIEELHNINHQAIVTNEIIKTLSSLSSIGSFEFGQAVAKYFEGYITDDTLLKKSALRWLKGEYTTKTDAKNELGIREIIDDQNYFDMLKNLAKFFVAIGYQGFVINFDEVVFLYNIVQTQTRDKNYEKIQTIYNDCLQGGTSHLYVNFACTPKFLNDERRGLFSNRALKTRLESSALADSTFRDLAQPVIFLPVLGHNELFVLLSKLNEVFNIHNGSDITATHGQIEQFMSIYLNRPGADEHLTPREISRGFLQLLSIVHQNKSTTIDSQLARLTNDAPSASQASVEIV
jgi:hypothetical protein